MREKKSQYKDKLGIYIHIPFCKSKCDYCDFYSLAGAEGRMDAYQKALLAHMKETAQVAGKIPVDTVYFGGGTPSYYGEKRLRELLKGVKKLFSVEKDAEITLEGLQPHLPGASVRLPLGAGRYPPPPQRGAGG